MRRQLLVGIAALAACAALPAAAAAHSVVSMDGSTIVYLARDATSQNTLTAAVTPDRVRFRDPTVDGGIDPGPCDPGQVDGNGYIIEVICRRGPDTRLRIDVADREDSVRVGEVGGAGPVPSVVSGGVGADSLIGGAATDDLDGGPGEDSLNGGAGDDVLRARDGVADRVTCGDGNDRAEVDAADAVDGTCETVDRADAPPGAGGGPSGGGPDGTPPVVEGGALTFQRIGRSRTLRVLATASEPAELAASATVIVGGRRLAFRPGRAQVRVAGGGATLRLRMSGAAWRTLKRALARRRPLSATVTVVATDPAGNSSATRLPRIRLAR
ncbi:MAG TPA: hypothetical protein VHF89_02825 [Solirubrobacteraceae bacterium]|nr:hypothetical protein [Solirubrobacteraceae bacterium]